MAVKRDKSPDPLIFSYVDYRAYLQDYYRHCKKHGRGFTYRSFAKAAGVSASLLKDILDGRQNLSTRIMKRYAEAMKLTSRQREYFEAMVCFNNSKTSTDKNRWLNRLIELRNSSRVTYLNTLQYEYFSTWYHPVVRELVGNPKLKGDPEAIAAGITPKVTKSRVKKSIKLLEKLGLISKTPDGKWHCTDTIVSSEYEIQSISLANYHAAMFGLAREGLTRWAPEKREYQTLTLQASRTMFKRLKSRIRSFTDEVLDMVAREDREPEAVFQLGLYLFPFTDSDGEQ